MTVPATAETAFRAFVTDPGFPCVAGRGVVRQGEYDFRVYGALGHAQLPSSESAHIRRSRGRGNPRWDLGSDLAAFVRTPPHGHTLRAFVAVFPDDPPKTEIEFEHRLWTQLRTLHAADVDTQWDAAVSDDPADPAFSFSFAGHAFFVIGLHPNSSRLARRFEYPTLVFNPHAQLERLRTTGNFGRMRTLIRERDKALQGSVNPNVADFGTISEARQYSGRATEPDWRCPFHNRNR